MLLFDVQDKRPLAEKHPALTMGVFDGVHRGHRKIIAELREIAGEISAPALAITFSPHPRQALGRAAPPAICSLEKRLALLREAGLDAVWVLPFTPEFSQKSAKDFANDFFRDRLGAGAVVLGEQAVFGLGREGNVRALASWAKPWGMRVVGAEPLVVEGTVVSSTAIRLAVQSGDLDRAARFLGRRVSVEGMVVHGQGRGHKLGFPTLNIDPYHELRPPPGVYFSQALIDGVGYESITNIGRPPTDQEIEAGLRDVLIETHLLDFHGDLYGRSVEVEFFRKKRDAMHFPDREDLTRQVRRDLAEARVWFANAGG